MRKRIGLILGSGRSGTTLLRSILNSSEHAFCVPETSFYSRFWSARHLIFIICIIFRLDFKLFILWLVFNRSHDPSMKNFKLNHEDYKKYGFNKLSNIDFFSLGFINLLKLIACKGNKDGINYIFEKTPDNILYINNFISLIKYDAVLNIRRNPLDIISSTINRGDLENNIYRPLAKILVGLKNIDQLGDFDNFKIHITSYEDLTNNSEESIFKICENINIPYSEEMLFLTILKAQVHMEGLDQKALKRARATSMKPFQPPHKKLLKTHIQIPHILKEQN